jgi:hypothetical protein
MNPARQSRNRIPRKRLECAQLAAALGPRRTFDSGSKLHALQTLRDIGRPPISSQPANDLDYCSIESGSGAGGCTVVVARSTT